MRIWRNKYYYLQMSWDTVWTVIKFKEFSVHQISKDSVSTWEDFTKSIAEEVSINEEIINIVINSRPAFYYDDTLMEDIDIKQDDTVMVMKKNSKIGEQQNKEMKRNKEDIQRKKNNYYKQAVKELKESVEKEENYQKFVKQYSKWQCLVALKELGDEGEDQNEVEDYLSSGKAKQFIRAMEEQRINKILNTNIKRYKDQLQRNKTPEKYREILEQICKLYSDFKELEVRNRIYIQNKLLGRELYPPRDISQEKRIVEIVEYARKRQEKDLNELRSLEKREMAHENPQFRIQSLNKTAKVNLILQLFSHPSFKDRLAALDNKEKCRDFLQFIMQKYSTNRQLIDLIKDCEEQIVITLSEVENDEDDAYYPFTQGLKRSGFDEKAALSLAKASQNDQKKLQSFLEAGGVIKNFHLCHPSEQLNYLSNYLNKNKDLLLKIKDEKAYETWMNAITKTDPQLFKMISRNIEFVSNLRANFKQ